MLASRTNAPAANPPRHFVEKALSKVLGKLPVPGRPTNLDYSRAWPIVLAVGAGGGCLNNFSLIYHFSILSLSLSLGDGPI